MHVGDTWQVLVDISAVSEAQGVALLGKLRDELGAVKNELMALEIDIVGQLEVCLASVFFASHRWQDTLKKFERNYADLTTTFIEYVQSNVTEVREAEEKFHKEMGDAAMHFSDKFSKGEIENALDYPDDIHAVTPHHHTTTPLMHRSCCATRARWPTR